LKEFNDSQLPGGAPLDIKEWFLKLDFETKADSANKITMSDLMKGFKLTSNSKLNIHDFFDQIVGEILDATMPSGKIEMLIKLKQGNSFVNIFTIELG
jgi:hypothetical protein